MMPSLDQSPYVMMMTVLTILMTMDGDVMAQLWPNYPEPGPDIHGRFCSIRRGGCCPGRDDHCIMPILDTVCYCDEFCVRTQADCCPDFRGTCTHRPESQTLINNCHHNGEIHAPGTMITVNCNNCTCVETHMTMPEYNWKCTQKTCLVRDELLEHINTNSGRFGWRASNYTFLWGMTLDDGIKYRLGTLKPHSLVQSMTSLRIRDVNDVPMTFDARKEWPSYIHPVLDQGNCGSSWALSTASVAADRLTLHSRGAYADMLSAQQILDCDIDYKQKGCEGGHLDRAWWYMRATGVVSEPCYPYKSGDTQVRGKCQIPRHMMRPSATSCPSGARGLKSPVYQVAPPYRISPNEKEIMKEIMENGPVQALMYVREDFFLYKGGVYHHSLPADFLPPNRHKTGYHSVKILGWGTDYSTGKPLKYWLCANSWGRHWGEDGYFRILRGVNESEIESFILGVWGKVNGRELRRHNRRMLLRHRLRHNRRRLRYRRHLMRTS